MDNYFLAPKKLATGVVRYARIKLSLVLAASISTLEQFDCNISNAADIVCEKRLYEAAFKSSNLSRAAAFFGAKKADEQPLFAFAASACAKTVLEHFVCSNIRAGIRRKR